jgi:type IV pilus assembly protein PilP
MMEGAMHRARFSTRVLRLACIVALAATALAACDETPQTGRGGGRGGKKASKSAAAAAAAAKKDTGPETIVYKDDDFVASIRNRDPFQSYTVQFKAKAPDEMQRRVIMSNTPIEEMRLIAIVTGMAQPKAMLVDPSGVGYVVQRGDYIGRPKVIQATGSVSMAINWRVDRIRDNEVVLTQQDPTDPTRAALTKIIPLRDEVAQK